MPGDQATCWELTPAGTWQYFGTLNGRSGGRDINETRESSLFQHGSNLCVIVHVMSCWYVILWANDSVNKWLVSGPNRSTLLCILHLHQCITNQTILGLPSQFRLYHRMRREVQVQSVMPVQPCPPARLCTPRGCIRLRDANIFERVSQLMGAQSSAQENLASVRCWGSIRS